MNCNTTHYRANSSSVPGDPTDSAAPRTYLAGEVDTPVRPRGLLARPLFPVEAPRAKRRLWFRYVVDTTGLVDVATLRGESPVADSLFVESLRVAARRWTFTPARKAGRAVRMEVRQVLEFEPGT